MACAGARLLRRTPLPHAAVHRDRARVHPVPGDNATSNNASWTANADGHPPWLHELAHYEWVELALQIADDELPPHDPGGDLLAGKPVPSPLAWALAYCWPVSRIGPEFQPERAPDAPTLLLVRRDTAGDVHFSELSPLVYRLLQLLDDDATTSGRAALQALATEAGATDIPAFIGDGTAMLQRLHGEGVLLGTRPA